MHIAHCTLHIANCTLHIAHWTLDIGLCEISFHDGGSDIGEAIEQGGLECWCIGADIIGIGDLGDALMSAWGELEPFLWEVIGLPILNLA